MGYSRNVSNIKIRDFIRDIRVFRGEYVVLVKPLISRRTRKRHGMFFLYNNTSDPFFQKCHIEINQ